MNVLTNSPGFAFPHRFGRALYLASLSTLTVDLVAGLVRITSLDGGQIAAVTASVCAGIIRHRCACIAADNDRWAARHGGRRPYRIVQGWARLAATTDGAACAWHVLLALAVLAPWPGFIPLAAAIAPFTTLIVGNVAWEKATDFA